MSEQITLFDLIRPKIVINKKIRLIELFGGYGSQRMALERLGANYEPYRMIEIDKYACNSYNMCANTQFKPIDIRTAKGIDLGIVEKERFTYLLTYSYPCTSLSIAGRQEGMERDSGTASSLIWEVERLLKECNELGAIPDILQMENVTECHNYKNISEFNEWTAFLESLGYTNYLADLNASDYLIPQHRERSIMFSILGNYNYKFPEPVKLEKCMADYLEDEVPENLYIKSEKALNLIMKLVDDGTLENENALTDRQTDRLCVDGTINKPQRIDIANCIKAKDRGLCNHRSEENCIIE